MQIPSFGADFIGSAVAFKQGIQAQNLSIAVAKSSMEAAKTQSDGLLQLLNPAHLGQKLDIRG